MTYPGYLRDKARQMRVEHSLTIDEIAERLALSRTTVFHWVRDLPIERKGRPPTGGQLKGSLAMQRKYRLLRENAYADGLATFDVLAPDPTFRDFVCLYLAEGSKRDRNKVQVCNSDPAVMILCHDWLNRLTDPAPALLRPVPRRPGSRRTQAVLGEQPGDSASRSPAVAEVKQRPARHAHVALCSWSALDLGQRHLAPSTGRRLDGPAASGLGLDSLNIGA
jgi:hypothetical protein